ncbi:MAG: hypothetical protein H7125_05330 [Proteobacteria bacterium]|nr:hypothetical protein [Burkholderiales bacterium]
MNAARMIATLGFRRWYERQLIESHLCLVTCFLCIILLAVCIEHALPQSALRGSAAAVFIAFAAAAGGIWSWNHYRVVFSRAERYGHVAHCEHCGTYARFEVERTSAASSRGEPTLNVRCRQCRHRWTMPEA